MCRVIMGYVHIYIYICILYLIFVIFDRVLSELFSTEESETTVGLRKAGTYANIPGANVSGK